MALIYFILWLFGMAIILPLQFISGLVLGGICLFLLSMYIWGFALGIIGGLIGILIVHALFGMLIMSSVTAICKFYVESFNESISMLNEWTLDKC